MISKPSVRSQGNDLPPYADRWGFKSPPFPVTPDETAYFFTTRTETIFEEVLHFIQMRKGFLLLTGDIGVGKTTLLRRLINALEPERFNTALMLASFLDQSELLESVVHDFGLEIDPDARRLDLLQRLNQFLLQQNDLGKINVLFIDDAQALDAKTLDVVRQLSNLETAKTKLIQIVLCGQPELLELLQLQHMRQVRSRITLSCAVEPMEMDEAREYLMHRMRFAGATEDLPQIEQMAMHYMVAITAGAPRKLNHLMDRCLYGLHASGQNTVDMKLVKRAALDLGWIHGPQHRTRPIAYIAAALQEKMASLASRWKPSFSLRRSKVWAIVAVLIVLGWLLGRANTLWPTATSSQAAWPEPTEWSIWQQKHWPKQPRAWPHIDSAEALVKTLQSMADETTPDASLAVWGPLAEMPRTCAAHPLLRIEAAGVWVALIHPAIPASPQAVGAESPGIRQTQILLNSFAYLPAGAVDGVMGPRTSSALSRLQQAWGMPRTGQFDAPTAYRLSCEISPTVGGTHG